MHFLTWTLYINKIYFKIIFKRKGRKFGLVRHLTQDVHIFYLMNLGRIERSVQKPQTSCRFNYKRSLLSNCHDFELEYYIKSHDFCVDQSLVTRQMPHSKEKWKGVSQRVCFQRCGQS